jgi:aminoglycoside 6'-N-acetyltransferase
VPGGKDGAGVVLRPMGRHDFPEFVDWLARPHVAEWWDPPFDLAGVEREYGPCIDGTDPTLLFIATEGSHDVGFAQIYRMADNPGYALAVGVEEAAGGLDLFVGDPARLGRGLGPQIIRAATSLIWRHYPEVHGALAGPSVRNTRSQRAFAKAGYAPLRQVEVPGEADPEVVMWCPRPGTRATAPP